MAQSSVNISRLKIYDFLSRLGFKKSYSSKFLLTAFIGTHIPLVGILIYVLFFYTQNISPITLIILVIAYTLLAAILTLFVLQKLLAPIKIATETMQQFEASQEIQELPTHYTDEAGVLLKQIHKTLNSVQQLTQERDNFTGLITHDLRNPLSSILALADFIADGSENEEVKNYAKLIKQSANTGIAIITDTVQLIQTKKFTIDTSDKKNIKLKSFVLKHIGLVKNINPAKKIEFIVNIPDEITVKAHKSFFGHALQNVLSNALKFSHINGKVFIDYKNINSSDILVIKDEGIGFPQQYANDLFQQFTPMKRQGTMKEPTTGLGMYLTKMLLQKQGASISANSEGENKGATFTITLP